MLGIFLLLLIATDAHAQESQFHFDPNGNLLVQTGEIVAPPQILAQPQNRIVAPDEAATFTVVAADTRLLAYQWRFNGTSIPGATNDAVVLQSVSSNREGEYRVVLTNPSGSVTSAPAMLWFDGDADGMADSFERTHFGSLNRLPNDDFDGDGASNVQEFLDGTDPANTNSVLFRLTIIRDGGAVEISPMLSGYTNGQIVTLTATASPGAEPFHAWLGDVITRDNPLTLVMTNNRAVFARFTPVLFTWTNLLSGDWNIARNWTPNLAPGSNDNVIIAVPTGPTVTLNTAVDCNDFTLGTATFPMTAPGSGTVTGSGTLTVRGRAFWYQGAMSGSGRTVIEDGATLSIANASSVGVILSERTLENAGTVRWIGAGSFAMNASVVLTNRAGGLLEVQSTASFIANDGSSRIDNVGVFRKSFSPGTATIGSGISFNNTGTMELQAGMLMFNGGFTNDGLFSVFSGATNRLAVGGTCNGRFTALPNAVVECAGGTITMNPGAELDGAGLYRLNGGSLTASANLTVENLDLVHGGSTLGGAGAVTVAALMNWTAGTMSGSGRTIISPGATLNAAIPGIAFLSQRILENGGIILFSGGGVFGVNSSAVITNRAGALFRIESEGVAGLGGSANGRFDNAGTFRKSAGTGTSTIVSGLNFNNYGTVEIQTGTLLCNAVFTHSGAVVLSPATTNRLVAGGSGSGSFNTPATATTEWTGGTFVLNPGAQLNGSGLFKINGGSIAANTELTVANLDLTHPSSTLSGAGAMTIATGMNWTSGTMSGSGRTIIAPGATLNAAIPNIAILSQRSLENGGIILFTGGGVFSVNSSAVITNRAGALFRIENENSSGFGGNGRFDNAGIFRKSAGVGTSTIAGGLVFNNSGTVDIRSGKLAANGGYTSTPGALLNCALGGPTPGTNYGQLQVAGAVTLNGGLSVELLNGFVPALNDSFAVLTAGSRNGTFGSFSFPSNAVTMQLSNAPTAVIARVTGVAPAQPVLLLPEFLGPDIRLTWSAVSNRTYRLEFIPGLGGTNWNPVPGDVSATSNAASKFDALTASNRFYRVRLLD